MRKQAPFIALFLMTACGPTAPAPEPIDDEPAMGSSTDDGASDGMDEPEGGSGSSSGSDESSTGGDAPECLLDGTGRSCLDVVEHLALCDEIEPLEDCAIALGRLFGSNHNAGAWAVGKPDSAECADLPGVEGCALEEDASVAECIELTECGFEAGPTTCAPLAEGVAEGLCERVVG